MLRCARIITRSPSTRTPNSSGNQVYPSYGLRDYEREPDGYLTASWVHTFRSNQVLTLSPFYHYNKANYGSSPNDYPVISSVNQASYYGGGQATLAATIAKKNDLEVGVYAFAQHQSNTFNNIFTDGSPNFAPSSAAVTGSLFETFVNDRFKATSWLTLIAGFRYSHFDSGSVSGSGQPGVAENAPDPRFGVSIRIPRINWVFHGFYGVFYQAPPLLTATGPLQDLATSQNLTFSPLHGERDHEYQFGVSIPFHGWVLEEDTFQTSSRNWLDHSNIGESNIFWPLTWDRALIQGWETTLRSPRLWHRAQVHVAYSNQIAQASAPFTGGLICPTPVPDGCEPPPGFSPVDHDQRNTLNIGATADAPLARLCLDQCVLRFRLHQRLTQRAVPRRLSAATHHRRRRLGQELRRRRSLPALAHRPERGQPAGAARQQPYLRGIPLQRSAADLRGIPLALPLLRTTEPERRWPA